MSAARPERLHVDWVESGADLQAYVAGECVAAADWDHAADAVAAVLQERAKTHPAGYVVAEFTHDGESLGTIRVDAQGRILAGEADDPDEPEPPHDAEGGTHPAAAPEPTVAHLIEADGADPDADSEVDWAADPADDAEPVPSWQHAIAYGTGAPWEVGAEPKSTLAEQVAGPSPAAIPGYEPAAAAARATGGQAPYRPAGAASTGAGSRTATATRPPRRPAPVRPPRRTRLTGRTVMIVGTVLACLLTIGLMATFLVRSDAKVAVAHAVSYAGRPPAEWDALARWRTPALLKEAGRVLMIDGTQMAFVTKDRQIVLVDAAQGDVRWSATYPDGAPHTDLMRSTIDGRAVIVAHVGDELTWWDLDSGRAHGVGVPSGGSVNLQGTAPVVVTEAGRTAATVKDGRLTSTPVPDGATVLGARSDGLITATSAAGWWHLSPGKPATDPTPWENPSSGGAPTTVGYLDDTIVTVLPAPAQGTAYVAVYADRAQDVRFSWGGAAWFDGKVADWFPAPSRTWGILGRTLIDLSSGRAADLGSWTTQQVGADRAVGLLGRQRVLVGPRIAPGVLPDDEAFPEDLARSGAAVRGTSNGDEFVYLLPPKGSA